MSTKSRDLKTRFEEIMAFESPDDRLEHESKVLMFKFLSHVEQEMDKSGMSKKELAELLKYLTELCNANFPWTKDH